MLLNYQRIDLSDLLEVDTDYYEYARRIDLVRAEKVLISDKLMFMRLKNFLDDLSVIILVLTEADDTQASFKYNSVQFMYNSRSKLKICYYNFNLLNNLYTKVKAKYDSEDAMSAIENALSDVKQ